MENINYLTDQDLTFVWLWLGGITIVLAVMAFILAIQVISNSATDRNIEDLRQDIERNYDFDQYRDTRINSLQSRDK